MSSEAEKVMSGASEEEQRAAVAEEERLRLVRAAAVDIALHRLEPILDLSGDEDALGEEAKIAAARILTLDEADLETARGIARAMLGSARAMCKVCSGRAVAKVSGKWEICECVLRRAADRRASVSRPAVPGRQLRKPEAAVRESAERLTEARESLERAVRARLEALSPIEERLMIVRAGVIDVLARRELRDAEAEVAASQALLCRAAAADSGAVEQRWRDWSRSVAQKIKESLDELLAIGGPLEEVEERLAARTESVSHLKKALGPIAAAQHESDLAGCWRQAFMRDAERWAEACKVACEEVAAIEAAHAPSLAEIARLEAERGRVARHHQPRVERAERRLSRLSYITGEQP